MQQRGIVGRQLTPLLLERPDKPAGLFHRHVEAHDQAAQRVQVLQRAEVCARVRCSRRRTDADSRCLGRRRGFGDPRLNAHERRSRVDVGAAGDEDVQDPAGIRGNDRHLHLHRLEDRDG